MYIMQFHYRIHLTRALPLRTFDLIQLLVSDEIAVCDYVTPILKAPSVISSYFRPLHVAFRSQSIAFLFSLISYFSLPHTFYSINTAAYGFLCHVVSCHLGFACALRPRPTFHPYHLSSTFFFSLSSRTQEASLVSYPYAKSRVRTLNSVFLAYLEYTFISH